jgi:hypothetical protein
MNAFTVNTLEIAIFSDLNVNVVAPAVPNVSPLTVVATGVSKTTRSPSKSV